MALDIYSKEMHDSLVKLDKRPIDNELDFDESTHTYTYRGKVLKSITTLLGEKGLSPNYDNVDKELLKESASRGTKIHKNIENWIKGQPYEKTDILANFIYMLYYKNWVVLGSEVIVHNDTHAGTIDLILLDKARHSIIVADIKTTSVVHRDSVEWQLSCYRHLDAYAKKEYSPNGYDYAYVIHIGKGSSVEPQLVDFKNIYAVSDLINLGVLPIITLDPNEVYALTTAIKRVEEYKQAQLQYQAFIDNFNQKLIEEMEKHSVKKFENDDIRVTYVAPVTKTSVDTKTLKAEMPDVAKKYEKTTTTKASVRIIIKPWEVGE